MIYVILLCYTIYVLFPERQATKRAPINPPQTRGVSVRLCHASPAPRPCGGAVPHALILLDPLLGEPVLEQARALGLPLAPIAPAGHRELKVAAVDPIIGAPFGALDDGHRLVVRADVLFARVGVEAVRPEHGAAALGMDGQVEVREVGAAALLDVGEVQEECERAGPHAASSCSGIQSWCSR